MSEGIPEKRKPGRPRKNPLPEMCPNGTQSKPSPPQAESADEEFAAGLICMECGHKLAVCRTINGHGLIIRTRYCQVFGQMYPSVERLEAKPAPATNALPLI